MCGNGELRRLRASGPHPALRVESELRSGDVFPTVQLEILVTVNARTRVPPIAPGAVARSSYCSTLPSRPVTKA
jgi:hypothetical protein